MTEQALCKSYFKEYLLYRIKEQKANLILSVVLNLLTLPLFFVGYISGFDNEYSTLYYFGTYFGIICGIFLIVLAVVGTVFSFEFYHRKNLTDTVGSLPLTYKQRFWGDFIAGYISNIAAVVPIGLITAIVIGAYMGADSSRFGYITEYDYNGTMFQFTLSISASLIFALTFVYLFSVLIISACGNILHSILFSIFGTGALCGTVAGLGGSYAVGMLGVDVSKYMAAAGSFAPPLGPIIDLMRCIRFFSARAFDFIDGITWLSPDEDENFFSSVDALHIVWFVIFGVAVTLGAYYVGKCRKTEKTGSAFTVKPMFYVLSSLSCVAGVFIITSMLFDSKLNHSSKLSIAAGTGVMMCVVSVVMYLPNKKSLTKCAVCGLAAIGVSVGIVALLKSTGSFGAVYLPENAKEIEYIKVDYGYFTITDKTDIKLFVKNHNDFLRENLYDLTYAKWFSEYDVEYKTSDGKIMTRGYNYVEDVKDAGTALWKNLRTLPGFGRYYFEMLDVVYPNFDGCHIVEEDIEYDISGEDYEKFYETLSREASEKYDPDAEIYAKAKFMSYTERGSFNIGDNFEDTIAILESLREAAAEDPNEVMLTVNYWSSGSDGVSLSINVRKNDMDDPLVKELIGLLKEDTDGNDDWDENFAVKYYNDASSDSAWEYYVVPRDNSARVLEIITELAFRD